MYPYIVTYGEVLYYVQTGIACGKLLTGHEAFARNTSNCSEWSLEIFSGTFNFSLCKSRDQGFDFEKKAVTTTFCTALGLAVLAYVGGS